MFDLVEYVHETDSVRDQLHAGDSIYGENVGETIVEYLDDRRDDDPFEWAHERLGFDGDEQGFEYL